MENLLGTMTVINGNTVWKDGILPEAMRRGYWLLLDEINSNEIPDLIEEQFVCQVL